MERARRADEKSLRAGQKSLRVQFGNGRGNLGELGGDRNRNGDGWIDRVPLFGKRPCGNQADDWAREPQQSYSNFAYAGYGWTDVPHGAGCGDLAGGVDGDGSRRQSDGGECWKVVHGLHQISRRRWIEGRAHRRPAKSVWVQSRGGQTDGRRARRDEETRSDAGGPSGDRNVWEVRGDGISRFHVRAESGLECVPRVAGAKRAGENAERNYRVQREECGEGDAVFWTGKFLEGRGERSADDPGICGCDQKEP